MAHYGVGSSSGFLHVLDRMSTKGKKEVDIAEKIGKAQQKPKKKSVSTTTVLVVIMGVVLAFVGFAFIAPSEKEGAAPASYKGVCRIIHE